MSDKRRNWLKPRLILLIRNTENFTLVACKHGVGPSGPVTVDSACDNGDRDCISNCDALLVS